MTLIQELQTHANNENIYYIEELANIIIDENINSVQELEEYEKEYNKVNDEYQTIEESIKKWIKIIDQYPYEYDGLLYDQIHELKRERKLIDVGTLENKILHIIKYYYLTKRDNPYPYQTYQLIIQNKL